MTYPGIEIDVYLRGAAGWTQRTDQRDSRGREAIVTWPALYSDRGACIYPHSLTPKPLSDCSTGTSTLTGGHSV